MGPMVVLPAHLACLGLRFPVWARFRRALEDPGKVQWALLQGLLRRNAQTQFGRQYGFSGIRSLDEFQRRVPLCLYEDLEPYLDRIAAGEERVLTDVPVHSFLPTGGSTGGTKIIPFTDDLRQEFQLAIAPWLFDMAVRHPDILGGTSYWSISPAGMDRDRRKGKIPIDFEDDSFYLGRWERKWVAKTLAVPPSVIAEPDMDRFRRLTLLHLLAREDLRLFSVWNPSFLSLLLQFLRSNWESLLKDLAEGRGIDPAPHRALRLGKVDPSIPRAIWPRLSLISCWTDGPAAGPAERLRNEFPDTVFESKGLMATEAVVTFPFGGRRPTALLSHFYEFIDGAGNVLGLHQLKEGTTYSVVVTTGGGLTRYRMRDRVQVDGFLRKTPCLTFLGKEEHISDLRGEKLEEGFVALSIAGAMKRTRLKAEFLVLAPGRSQEPPGYDLFWEGPDFEPQTFEEDLEGMFRRNFHYDYCRRLGQLRPVRVRFLRPGSGEAYWRERHRAGQKLGDIKPAVLESRAEVLALLEGRTRR